MAGYIGAFYLSDFSAYIYPDVLTVDVSAVEPTVIGGHSVTVNARPVFMVVTVRDPLPVAVQEFTCDFSASPVSDTSPLAAVFTAWYTQAANHLTNHGAVAKYRWYFDFANEPTTYVETTSASIAHVYRGYYGQQFTVKLTVYAADNNSTSKTRTSYITTCGIQSDVRDGQQRLIDLSSMIPDYLITTETADFLDFFEGFLNEMCEGTRGFSATATDATETFTSAVGHVGELRDMEDVLYSPDSSLSARNISILEKVFRLTETHDPELIDLNFINHFAQYMGYSVDVTRGELGVNAAGACSADDTKRYIRFVLENLPHWYKIKTTRSAVKVMLLSFGLIGDIVAYYTNDYATKWKTSELVWNGTEMKEDLTDIPNDYYPTPHFAIWYDVAQSQTNFSFDITSQAQILKAIEKIRPVNTVLRGVIGYYAPGARTIYARALNRQHRYIRIVSDTSCDSWV